MEGSLTKVVGTEKEFRDREPLVIHHEDLIIVRDNIPWLANPSLLVLSQVGEYIFANDRVPLRICPAGWMKRRIYEEDGLGTHRQTSRSCLKLDETRQQDSLTWFMM
jgi:hypothetical protein